MRRFISIPRDREPHRSIYLHKHDMTVQNGECHHRVYIHCILRYSLSIQGSTRCVYSVSVCPPVLFRYLQVPFLSICVGVVGIKSFKANSSEDESPDYV